MPNTAPSTNMMLPIPVVGVDPGPDYATNVNNCLTIIDQHSHLPGAGVPITPAAMNINADIPMMDNNITAIRSLRFQSQGSVLALPTDIGCLYESGVDLYYNDGSGNQIRITQSGGISGTPGSISGLVPPAAASYVSGSQTFVWQSGVNTPANSDIASLTLRNLVANSKGLTLNPPNAMGVDYSITLPVLPGSNLPLSINSSGIMTAAAVTYVQLAAPIQVMLNTVPTRQVLTSSGLYTTPPNVTYLKIRMIGGGGGGAAGSPGNAPGTDGTASTFGSILTASPGLGASTNTGGAGGTASISAPAYGSGFPGASGNAGAQQTGGTITSTAGVGAGSPFAGGGNTAFRGTGGNGSPNTGTGGGGGGMNSAATGFNGSGGGAGAYIDVIIPAPAATYSYVVGVGGVGGTQGGAFAPGGDGGSGIIIVEEHYGS